MEKYNLIIMATDEKGSLYKETGYLNKYLIPILGKPMLDWVIEAFFMSQYVENIIVIGHEELDKLASMRYVKKRINPSNNFVQNTLAGVNYIKTNIYKNSNKHNGYLFSFGDAVFLNHKIIEDSLIKIYQGNADIVLSYIEKNSFKKKKIKADRDYFAFNNKYYTKSNLYYIKNFNNSINSLQMLQEFINSKNNPDKMLEKIGYKEKNLDDLENYFSKKLNSRLKIIIQPYPQLGMNIEKISDLKSAKRYLKNPWKHSYKKTMIIYNPQAGQSAPLTPVFRQILGIKQRKYETYDNKDNYIMNIQKYLKEYGIKAKITYTKFPGHATLIAAECVKKKYNLVIAAGGDGTINEVVNGLAYSNTTLGIIPLGTANVLGIQLMIPAEIKAACQIIANGNKKRIDLGKIQDRYFVSMSGVGFDAHVIKKTGSKIKKLFGALSYVFVALSELFTYRFKQIIVKIDEQPIPRRGYFVIIGNGKYYGGDMVVATHADMTDGYLDVCIFKHRNILKLISYFMGMKLGRIDKNMSVEYFQCKKISILKSGKHAVHVDAEYLCRTPVDVEICPKALTIAV